MKAKVFVQHHDSSTWKESQYHKTPNKTAIQKKQCNTGGEGFSSLFSQGQNKLIRTTLQQLGLLLKHM